VWKREDSELLCVLEGHTSSVLSVALGLEGALAGAVARASFCNHPPPPHSTIL
jgi:hypothetical protein